jgi:hypothetical protein
MDVLFGVNLFIPMEYKKRAEKNIEKLEQKR